MTPEQELRRDEAIRWWEFAQKAIGFSKDYGTATLQALILANGGAIIACLTAITSLLSKGDTIGRALAVGLSTPILFFIIGLILAIVASGIGYLNFIALAASMPGPNGLKKYVESGDVGDWRRKKWTISTTMWLGISCVILSVASFCGGSWAAVGIFSRVAA